VLKLGPAYQVLFGTFLPLHCIRGTQLRQMPFFLRGINSPVSIVLLPGSYVWSQLASTSERDPSPTSLGVFSC
jgi:hypothetical protein